MPRGWGRTFDYSGKPRKGCTAYNFYIQENYRFFRRALRDRDPHRIIREAAGRWRGLPRDRKEQYKKMAIEDKERAKQEKLEYQRQITEGLIEMPPPRIRANFQPGYPRLTMNSFLYYARDMRKKVSLEFPNYDSREVMQELGRRWKQIPQYKRRDWQRLRDTDRNRFRAAKKQFREKQRDEKRKKRLLEGRERLIRMFHSKIPAAQLEDGPPTVATAEPGK